MNSQETNTNSACENKNGRAGEAVIDPSGSAAFQTRFVVRDVQAGIITGAMAIPLSVGIAMMSDYPIKVALATVVFACFVGWVNAWIRPGNYIGAPGVAAGLAPVLALGVSSLGMENMAFVIFLTASMQAVIWKFNLQKYILIAVPSYLVEGLLAGVGLKIAINFCAMTYEISPSLETDVFLNAARIQMMLISLAGLGLFLYLFMRFQYTQPAIPYFVLITAGVVLAHFMSVPMLHIDDDPLTLALPIPRFDSAIVWLYVFGFALMLAVIDVIEQVMSNAAIEKIDPLKRKCNTNNSLLAIWIANMGASFFNGMTNLDGIAKSTTNKLAGAYTKFSLAVVMIFSGWKMIAGLLHVALHGRYELMLATICALLVYKLGIFEGLLVALVLHGLINYIVLNKAHDVQGKAIIKGYLERFSGKGGAD